MGVLGGGEGALEVPAFLVILGVSVDGMAGGVVAHQPGVEGVLMAGAFQDPAAIHCLGPGGMRMQVWVVVVEVLSLRDARPVAAGVVRVWL